MGRAKSKKKIASEISGKVEKRIVALSLQNPEFGARRLVPLLQKKKISVSSSRIYTILKRHGLQNRAKRLAKLKEKAAKKTPIPKKKPTRILPEVEKQIVEVSLQHPEFGARRLLPLLSAEGIEVSASAVNSVLRCNGLQNREKRLARSRGQQADDAVPAETVESPLLDPFETSLQPEDPEWGPEDIDPIIPDAAEEPELGSEAIKPIIADLVEEQEWDPESIDPIIQDPAEVPDFGPEAIEPIITAPEVEPQGIPEAIDQKTAAPEAESPPLTGIIEEPIKPPHAEPQQPAPEIIEKIPPPQVVADVKPTKKAKIRGLWFLTLINLLLFLMLGFFGFYAWQNVLQVNPEPELIAAISQTPAIALPKPSTPAPPLSSYRMITERDVFNTSKEEAPAPKKEIDLEKIDPARKNLGLKLVGTVVVDDSNLSVAIIDNQKIHKQEAYREGDQANEVRIKKVMRNQVIIVTEEGDRLLTVETEKTSKRSKSPTYARQIPGGADTPSQIPGQMPAARTSSITLAREDVESALEDTEKLLQEVKAAPYMQGDQATGIRLNRIPAKNIFRKMGLRSRDVIVGVNGEAILGPEQVEDFIRTIGEGGEVTITLKRRRRNRQIKLNIE